jgi:hypothetical protein
MADEVALPLAVRSLELANPVEWLKVTGSPTVSRTMLEKAVSLFWPKASTR